MGIESIHESYVKSRRLTVLADHFAELIPDQSTVMDVGSGDGGLAAAIIARKPTLRFKKESTHLSGRTRESLWKSLTAEQSPQRTTPLTTCCSRMCCTTPEDPNDPVA